MACNWKDSQTYWNAVSPPAPLPLPPPPPHPHQVHTVEVGKTLGELVLTLIKLLDLSVALFSDLENEGSELGDF